MPKASPIQTAFNGGELSPYLAGRPDVAKYSSGCEVMEGWLPMVEGPAVTRPGTVYVSEVKDSTDQTWLMRFEFSASDSYMLEFGDQYIRFYYNRGQVQVSGVTAYNALTAYSVGDLASSAGVNYYCIAATTGNAPPNATYWYPLTGTIYEIPTPYAAADLTDDDGVFALRFVQTGDVIYIVHRSYGPRKLQRFGATDWVLTGIDFSPFPFKPLNTTTTTIYASAATGSVTLTASASLFTAAMVGQMVYIGEKSVRDTLKWEAGVSISSGNIRRYDGKNYEALNTATTGGSPPIHVAGAEYDGNSGVQWQYRDPGYGWAKITAYTSATVVTALVSSAIPAGAVGAGNASTRWALQAWNIDDGYPSAVTFFRERLVFSRDETIWFSVTGDFENFSTEIDGVVTADSGFERTIASDRANSIRWMSPGDVLLVGTIGDEWAITESTTSDPFGPDNVKTKRQSTYGSNTMAPIRVGNETLFIQRAGRKARAMAFQFTEDGFQSPNVAAFARTITGTGVTDMAYQQEPWSVVWFTRSDGLMVGMTMDREQDVIAWHRHPFEGGAVECVECIPSPSTGRDDLWLIVRYTINGSTKRYIAYLADPDEEDTLQADWKYADMLATYSGASASTITGLSYLEGKEVWVLVNGAAHPNRTVSGGQITLSWPGTKVQVGLPSPATLTLMNMDGGNPNGTAQGKTKRAHVVTLRLYRSLGGKAGPNEDNLEEIRYRPQPAVLGSPPDHYTGDVDVEWPDDYSKDMKPTIVKDRPMPMTLVAVMPQANVEGGR